MLQVAFYFAFMHHYTRWLGYIAAPSLAVLVLQLMPVSLSCEPGKPCRLALWFGIDSLWAPIFAVVSSHLPASWWDAALRPLSNAVRSAPHQASRTLQPTLFSPHQVLSVWASLFLEFWKRYQSTLAFCWDVTDFEEEEISRPEFLRNRQTQLKQGYYSKRGGFIPIGDEVTPYFPRSILYSRLARAGLVTLFFVFVAVIGTVSILALRVFLRVWPAFADLLPKTDGSEEWSSGPKDGDVDSNFSILSYLDPSTMAMLVSVMQSYFKCTTCRSSVAAGISMVHLLCCKHSVTSLIVKQPSLHTPLV